MADKLIAALAKAEGAFQSHHKITLPKVSDQLWIVSDGFTTCAGIGATLNVVRNGKLLLAGFFSAQMKKHQVSWLLPPELS